MCIESVYMFSDLNREQLLPVIRAYNAEHYDDLFPYVGKRVKCIQTDEHGNVTVSSITTSTPVAPRIDDEEYDAWRCLCSLRAEDKRKKLFPVCKDPFAMKTTFLPQVPKGFIRTKIGTDAAYLERAATATEDSRHTIATVRGKETIERFLTAEDDSGNRLTGSRGRMTADVMSGKCYFHVRKMLAGNRATGGKPNEDGDYASLEGGQAHIRKVSEDDVRDICQDAFLLWWTDRRDIAKQAMAACGKSATRAQLADARFRALDAAALVRCRNAYVTFMKALSNERAASKRPERANRYRGMIDEAGLVTRLVDNDTDDTLNLFSLGKSSLDVEYIRLASTGYDVVPMVNGNHDTETGALLPVQTDILSQESIASAMGIHRSSVSRIVARLRKTLWASGLIRILRGKRDARRTTKRHFLSTDYTRYAFIGVRTQTVLSRKQRPVKSIRVPHGPQQSAPLTRTSTGQRLADHRANNKSLVAWNNAVTAMNTVPYVHPPYAVKDRSIGQEVNYIGTLPAYR